MREARHAIKVLKLLRDTGNTRSVQTPEASGWSEFNGGTVDNSRGRLLSSFSEREPEGTRGSQLPWTPRNSIITRRLAMIKIFRHLACIRNINIHVVSRKAEGEGERETTIIWKCQRERDQKGTAPYSLIK